MTSPKPKSLHQSEKFRIRIGESGCELILKLTVIAGLATGALKKCGF